MAMAMACIMSGRRCVATTLLKGANNWGGGRGQGVWMSGPDPLKIQTRNNTSGSGSLLSWDWEDHVVKSSMELRPPGPQYVEIWGFEPDIGWMAGLKVPSGRPKVWSSPFPKEEVFFDGVDFEHWVVTLDDPSLRRLDRHVLLHHFVYMVSSVVGCSVEEATKRIYSFGGDRFRVLVPEHLAPRFIGQHGVEWVLPDQYLDAENKEYGGDYELVDGEIKYIERVYDPDSEVWRRKNA